jgi:hypothetical protein
MQAAGSIRKSALIDRLNARFCCPWINGLEEFRSAEAVLYAVSEAHDSFVVLTADVETIVQVPALPAATLQRFRANSYRFFISLPGILQRIMSFGFRHRYQETMYLTYSSVTASGTTGGFSTVSSADFVSSATGTTGSL